MTVAIGIACFILGVLVGKEVEKETMAVLLEKVRYDLDDAKTALEHLREELNDISNRHRDD